MSRLHRAVTLSQGMPPSQASFGHIEYAFHALFLVALEEQELLVAEEGIFTDPGCGEFYHLWLGT